MTKVMNLKSRLLAILLTVALVATSIFLVAPAKAHAEDKGNNGEIVPLSGATITGYLTCGPEDAFVVFAWHLIEGEDGYEGEDYEEGDSYYMRGSGPFELSGLQPGKYRIAASPHWGTEEIYYYTQYKEGATGTTGEDYTFIEITGDETVSNINITPIKLPDGISELVLGIGSVKDLNTTDNLNPNPDALFEVEITVTYEGGQAILEYPEEFSLVGGGSVQNDGGTVRLKVGQKILFPLVSSEYNGMSFNVTPPNGYALDTSKSTPVNTEILISDNKPVEAIYNFTFGTAPQKVALTYHVNGGKALKTTSKTVTVGAKYSTLPSPTRSGYKFAGWWTAKSGGSKVTSSSVVKTTKAHTIYAHWTKTYVVKFNSKGGKSIASKTIEKNKTIGTLKSPTKSGYKFLGWYTKAKGGKKITKTTKVTKNITYYAHWKKK